MALMNDRLSLRNRLLKDMLVIDVDHMPEIDLSVNLQLEIIKTCKSHDYLVMIIPKPLEFFRKRRISNVQ